MQTGTTDAQLLQQTITNVINSQECGVAVAAPPHPEVRVLARSWSQSLSFEEVRLRALSVSSGLLCNFVAVYLTFAQSTLQLKLSLCTIVHHLSLL